jgi:membrane protease YdiL (CAAX protease family)
MVSYFSARISNGQLWQNLSLAQVAVEEVEPTVGGVLAVFCVLGAFSGSLFVIATWRGRWSRGEPVIPAAQRPGISVPASIVVFGLLIAVFMAWMAISAGFVAESPNVVVADSSPQAESDATDAVNSESEAEPTEALPKPSTPSFESFEAALIKTAILDVFLILVLGIPIWWLHRQRMTAADDVKPQEQPGAVDTLLADRDFLQSGQCDESDRHAIGTNDPFRPPREPDKRQSALRSMTEPWEFGREFRYAAEAVLAAWLPTAALRLIMVMISQDESQHPFLEMISNGVGIRVLLWIAGTAVFLAPLMEELLYRVVILGGLLFRGDVQTPWSSALAIGASSVLFAFAHGFPDSMALLPLAIIIGWTYHQRRSYLTVVLIHFLFNAFNIVIAGLGMV